MIQFHFERCMYLSPLIRGSDLALETSKTKKGNCEFYDWLFSNDIFSYYFHVPEKVLFLVYAFMMLCFFCVCLHISWKGWPQEFRRRQIRWEFESSSVLFTNHKLLEEKLFPSPFVLARGKYGSLLLVSRLLLNTLFLCL